MVQTPDPLSGEWLPGTTPEDVMAYIYATTGRPPTEERLEAEMMKVRLAEALADAEERSLAENAGHFRPMDPRDRAPYGEWYAATVVMEDDDGLISVRGLVNDAIDAPLRTVYGVMLPSTGSSDTTALEQLRETLNASVAPILPLGISMETPETECAEPEPKKEWTDLATGKTIGEIIKDINDAGELALIGAAAIGINGLARIVHKRATAKGFSNPSALDAENVPLFLTKLMLVCAELGEVANAAQRGNFEDVPEEMADVAIRLFDLAAAVGISLGTEMQTKMERNLARPMMHGKLV